MRNIAVVLSLVALAFTVTSCTKGCKKDPPTPTEQKGAENKDADAAPGKDEEVKKEPEAKKEGGAVENIKSTWNVKEGQQLFAVINTNLGTIKAELYWDKVPETVWNFAALASGKKEWVNPKTGGKDTTPLYNGTIFHRVIKGFMIQGGDPMGTGMGGPGFRFGDEFNPELKHDRAGILSMANAGPNTNGSQFFITEGPTPHLDNRHSVFGAVKEGLEIVNKIASVPTGPGDKPQSDVVITNIEITTSNG